MTEPVKNVLGGELQLCGGEPMTGFFRDGYCQTCKQDLGQHTVCAVVSAEFLQFSAERGNDLITARPESDFPGLIPGDRWCLCAGRWLEAYQAGCAPPVILNATHMDTLALIPLNVLSAHALDVH